MKEMNIKEQWNQLDPTTQQWFIDNPGCLILPRTMTAIINIETGEGDDADQHGEMVLSSEDQQFIQAKARECGSVPAAAPPFRFLTRRSPEAPTPAMPASVQSPALRPTPPVAV